jgi:hypothetical protein
VGDIAWLPNGNNPNTVFSHFVWYFRWLKDHLEWPPFF